MSSACFFFVRVTGMSLVSSMFFFFNDTATTEIYTLSLHDALPIYRLGRRRGHRSLLLALPPRVVADRSEEHTSELQSLAYLVCRLLLEKKNRQPPSAPPRSVFPRARD